MTMKRLLILCALSTLYFLQAVAEEPKEEEDDIMSFDDKKPIPIKSQSSVSTKSAGSASTNPYNGIQELTNQLKDGNFNNLKKISDSNTNVMMSVLGLGSNWVSTNLRLASQWNDLNRDIAEKTIKAIHKVHDNNLRFLKQTVENNNNKTKATWEPIFQKIQGLRDTFNANGKDDSSNSLSLVSKSGRPIETLAEIKDELPLGLVNAASSWYSG